jgi:gamma-glutamyltranspeptidase/glutathione hydrolase
LYERGALATAAPIATTVGKEVFKQGGNAFDVAVAVGFTLAVVHPQAGNVGGGGFAVVRDGVTGEVLALDFRETAPALASHDMYLDENQEPVAGPSTYGAKAAGVPGTVAGLYELWREYGSLPWEDLVSAAADLADTGFILDTYLAESLSEYKDDLSGFTETADIFFPGGRRLKAGDKLVQKDLAATLYAIATEGPEAFYAGQIAEKIEACMLSHGGLIRRSDLAEYSAIWRAPIRFDFDSLEVYSMCPPSSGGIALGQILMLLEPYDCSAYASRPAEFIHLFAEASRLAFADRSKHLGDPEFYEIPEGLLSRQYLQGRRNTIKADHTADSELIGPGNPPMFECDQTTHFSVCDDRGNMAAITTTLNTSYGSKLVVSGAGFLLNNEMDDFSIKPGYPNTYGLVGAEANKIEPGKRMLSSMSPTLVFKDGKPLLILGSPGGSRIITTVAQAIINFSRFGLSVDEIAAYPRYHHQWLPDRLYLERGGFDESTRQTLESYGHTIQECSPFGDIQMVYIDPLGLMVPVSDLRNRGMAAGY